MSGLGKRERVVLRAQMSPAGETQKQPAESEAEAEGRQRYLRAFMRFFFARASSQAG